MDMNFIERKLVAVGTSDYHHRAAGQEIERVSSRSQLFRVSVRKDPKSRSPTGKFGMQKDLST